MKMIKCEKFAFFFGRSNPQCQLNPGHEGDCSLAIPPGFELIKTIHPDHPKQVGVVKRVTEKK